MAATERRVLHVLPHRGGGGDTYVDILASMAERGLAKVALSDVSASFVMEEIKETTVVPMELR